MANSVLDQWTGPDASGFYEHFELPTQQGVDTKPSTKRTKLYRLVESMEKGVVTERWLEVRILGAKWRVVEDTDEAYFILRDRLAELIKEKRADG